MPLQGEFELHYDPAGDMSVQIMPDWAMLKFSFVSPVVALILGAIVLDEPLTWREVVGAAIMLAAAAIAVMPRKEAASA